MSPKKRTPGWRPIEQLRSSGPPRIAEVLARALSREGRDDRVTHGFHTYPAGVHPAAVADLLELMSGERLLDPFCGGGTTLVEGLLGGWEVLGADLSPVAGLVAATRCWVARPEQITAMRSAARKITARARESDEPAAPPDESLRDWYCPAAGRELTLLLRGIGELSDAPVRRALRACASAIAIKASYRESDTSMSRRVRQRPRGTTAVLFHKKVRELGRRLEALAAEVPPGTPAAEVLRSDARSLRLDRPAHAVITSPPYPGVYDYLPLQALRVAWLGLDDHMARRQEIASRRAFRADRRSAVRRWREQTRAWMSQLASQLVPGARVAVIIGDGLVGQRTVDSLEPTLHAGGDAGLVPLAHASGARYDPGRGAARLEHIVLLEYTGPPTG